MLRTVPGGVKEGRNGGNLPQLEQDPGRTLAAMARRKKNHLTPSPYPRFSQHAQSPRDGKTEITKKINNPKTPLQLTHSDALEVKTPQKLNLK